MFNTTTSLILLALAGGMAVTVQGQFMGQMDRNIGTLESVFITYGIGAITISVFMIYLKGGSLATALHAVPVYTFLSGVLGLVIVGTIGFTVPRLGITVAFTVILLGQFGLAAILDHFGAFGSVPRPIGLKQLSGLVVILAGTYLVTS